MSSDGTYAPGKDFKETVEAESDTQIELKIGEPPQTIAAAATHLGGNNYEVTSNGSNIVCPGPIRVYVKGVQVKCFAVSPCP